MSWDFDRDFIKIPRRLVKLLRDDPQSFTTYAALLVRAAWQPTTVATKHGPVALKRGQAVFGRTELAQLCAASERAIRRSISVLQTIQAIALDPTNHGTVVTILGYDVSAEETAGRDPAVDPARRAGSRPESGQQPAPKAATILDLRSEKVDRTAEHARVRDPSTPAPIPVKAPVRSTELNPERARLHGLALDRLNQARLDIGGRLKQSLRPLHPFDNKLRDAVSFLLADEIIGRFEADLEHVLQIRIAEALANPKKNLRWLSSSLFEWGAWRVALSMTLSDVGPGEHDGPRELAYAPVREEDDEPDFTMGCGIAGGVR